MKWYVSGTLLLLIFACTIYFWHQHYFTPNKQETATIIKSSNQLETVQQTVFESKVKLPANVVFVKSDTCNPPNTRPYEAYMNLWNEQMKVWNVEERCPRMQYTHDTEIE